MSREYTCTRVRGLAPWRPSAKTRVLLQQVAEVLVEYRDHLPLTNRQVFYRLVGRYDYPKDEHAYERLGEAMNRARRSGVVATVTQALGEQERQELMDELDQREPEGW